MWARAALSIGSLLLLSGMALAAPPQNFRLRADPVEVPNLRFVDVEGQPMQLRDFRGKVILLNIWATWCPPCVAEMPTLEALEFELGGDDFQVLLLSIDKDGVSVIKPFYNSLGLQELEIYADETMLAATALGSLALPTTLLIDAEGNELGRLVGPAEWNAPEMVEFIKGFID